MSSPVGGGEEKTIHLCVSIQFPQTEVTPVNLGLPRRENTCVDMEMFTHLA